MRRKNIANADGMTEYLPVAGAIGGLYIAAMTVLPGLAEVHFLFYSDRLCKTTWRFGK